MIVGLGSGVNGIRIIATKEMSTLDLAFMSNLSADGRLMERVIAVNGRTFHVSARDLAALRDFLSSIDLKHPGAVL